MNTIPDDSTTSDSTITQCSEDRILDKEVECKIEQIDGTQSSAIADMDRSEENNDVASSAKQENNNVSKATSEMCRQPSTKIIQDIKMTNHETLRNLPNEIHKIHKNDTAVSNTSAAATATTSAPTPTPTTTLHSRKTLATSARRGLTKNESSPSRNCYEYHWKKLAKLTATECSNLHIAVTHECKAVRTSASNHKKSREKCWASMFGGGMIGTYDTKEEAIKRAVCAAIVTGDFEKPYDPFTPPNKRRRSSSTLQSNLLPTEEPMDNSSSRDHLMESSSSTSPLPNHYKKTITNHKIPESVTRPENNSTNLHLHNDDIATTTTSVEELTTGKPKACEMSDPVTGEVLQTFRSCSEAERITKISRATIGKACREGGGLVDNKLFRYVYDRDDIGIEPTNHDNQNIETNPLKTIQNNTNEKPFERELNTFLESDKASDNIPPPVKYLDFTRKSTTTNRSLKSTNFDITKLHPVYARTAPGIRKRLIELICRGTGKSLLYFRGYGVAAKALQIEKSVVKKMCEAQNSDNESLFPSFKLRYASQSSMKSLYEFGKHKDDAKIIEETVEERMRRWDSTLQQENHNSNNPQHTMPGNVKKDMNVKTQNPDVLPTTRHSVDDQTNFLAVNERTASSFSNDNSYTVPCLPVVPARKSISLFNNDQNCIVCQNKESQIVLEPCHHFVLCADCVQAGHCRKFCPICRMPILSRSQPSFLKRVQPRIYSVNSFF